MVATEVRSDCGCSVFTGRVGGFKIKIRQEYEPCGCSVEVITITSWATLRGPIVVRDRIAVGGPDCPHDHQLGARLTQGGRRPRQR